MNIILYLAEAFLVAYVMRLVAYRFKIPAVSGYVVGGVLLGGSLFFWIPGAREFSEQWLFSESARSQLNFITHIALGTIALTIGAELEWKRIKKLGISICCIAVFEAFGTFLLVSLMIFLIWKDLSLAFILGAVSSATAPAATVSVIQQYRSRGPLTKTILAVVGIDDAISFIIFAFAIAVTKANLHGEHIDIISGLIKPVLEIIMSVSIGAGIGIIGARLLVSAKDQESVIFVLGAIILWITGITALIDVSELLANMACGVIIINIYPQLKSKIRSGFSSFMPLFYALFFIIGGAHLNISMLRFIWVLAIIYFVTRSFGKIIGASIGALVSGALPQVKKLIGFSLIPQVGAAIALALVVHQEFGNGDYGQPGLDIAQKTMNVLLITTLLTEFIGPYLTKISLIKAGEAKE